MLSPSTSSMPASTWLGLGFGLGLGLGLGLGVGLGWGLEGPRVYPPLLSRGHHHPLEHLRGMVGGLG